jgi:3'-phosphoadenosine 5'-phosphosulfate sulfotransferase (PAPS reductase)/FAD synthetase
VLTGVLQDLQLLRTLDVQFVTVPEGFLLAVLVDKFQYAQNVCNSVSEKADTVALFFSGGKDSVALLDIMAKYFKKIWLVNMYFVEGLEHINKFVEAACIKYPNCEPYYTEHWIVNQIKKGGLYCIPDYSLKNLKLLDVDDRIRKELNVEYTFYGMKRADSLNRAMMLKGYEGSISKANKVYPLAILNNNDVLAYIRMKKLSKPIEYSKSKKSQGVIFDKDVFLYLQENYPQDLEKIYQKFPLSKRILFEHDKQD